MNPTTPVLDLSSVVAALASFGGVAYLISLLRVLFLDRLISGMDAASQNIVLRAVNVLLNFAAIVGLSLLIGMPFSADLVRSAVIATLGLAAPLSHVSYTQVKAQVTSRAQDSAAASSVPSQYPVYPPAAEEVTAPSVPVA